MTSAIHPSRARGSSTGLRRNVDPEPSNHRSEGRLPDAREPTGAGDATPERESPAGRVAAPVPRRAGRLGLAWVPFPAFLALILALRLLAPSLVYDPPWLILVANLALIMGVGLVVAIIAASSYRTNGRIQVLLLGCGVLAFGVGGGVAALVRGLPGGANLNVTVYNGGALLGAAFHAGAAFILLAGISPESDAERRAAWLSLGYVATVLPLLGLAAAALLGWTPPFFIQEVGPTLLRQAILGAACVLFAFSAVVFLGTYLRTREQLLYWYAAALALTATSLLAFLVQPSVGSPVGWTGRLAQYVASAYFLVSLRVAARVARTRGMSLHGVLTASLSGAEEKFRALAEAAPDVIRRFDAELRHIYVNAAAERLFGRPARSLVGKGVEALGLAPEQARLWRERLATVIRTGQPLEVEEELSSPDGSRYFHSRCVPELHPGGAVARVLVVSRDLTERRRAEEAVRQSESRYRSLFNGMSEGFAVHELVTDEGGEPVDFRYLEVNPAFERLTGLRREALVGRTFRTALSPESPRWLPDFARVVRTGQPLQFEEASAELGRHFEVLAFRNAPGQFAVLIRDVSERRRSEEVRRRSEGRLRLLSRTAARLLAAEDPQDAIDDLCRQVMEHLDCQLFLNFLSDEETGRLHLNAWAGISSQEARRLEWLDPGSSVSGSVARERQPAVVEDVLHSADERVELIRSYGVRAYCCHPLLAGDRVLGTLAFGTLLRDQFTEDEVQLMHTVSAQVAVAIERVRARLALRQANVQLVEADRRKNEFLAVLSHELRNPLAPIHNSLYILDHAPAGGDQARRAQQVIGRQVRQLANLVNDLLDVTRITRNKIQLQRERLDLNEVVQRTADDHHAVFERAGVQLDVQAASGAVWVHADRTRIAQVIGNLLQNSAKFTHRGGKVHVSVGTEGGHAVIRVADDGVGMAPETVARLFQPFMQADESLDRSKGGLGLGLALVKGLVTLHGGTIRARSDGIGKGAEFLVQLPLSDGASAAARPARARKRPTHRRLLIIEDNVDAAESLREMLELQAHEVAVAHDGPQGVASAREFKPDVVLCDIGLPGMDGYEVARTLRADRTLAGMHLVALSGYALPEDLARAREMGFDRHLAKPPTWEMLEDLLETLQP